MAIDTKQKRSSAIGVRWSWLPVLPDPDGAVGQLDRQDVAFSYAGISALIIAAAVEKVFTVAAFATTFAARAFASTFSVPAFKTVFTARTD